MERTIKHKVFTYYVEDQKGLKPDGSIGKVVFERQARRGETVDLREHDANRGDALGAFYTDEELKAIASAAAGVSPEVVDVPPATAVDLTQMSEGEITSWLKGDGPGPKPSVPQALSAVRAIEDEDERAESAAKVIAAEKARGGSDPRSTLVEPLEELYEEETE